MVRAHARAIARGPRVCVLADGHLTSVIFTARAGMPEIGPVIPGIENRHQSAVSVRSRPAWVRSREAGRVRSDGDGWCPVMPGLEWVLLMRVYAGRLCPAGLMRHYVSRLALPVSRRLAHHPDWLTTAKVRVLLNRV
jgi:hypothetical protein